MHAARALRRRLSGADSSVEVEHGRGAGSQGDVVFAGPLPPAPTGIATYDEAVLAGLDRIGFAGRVAMDVVWPVEGRLAGRFPGYHLGVFQLGNNVEFHLEIYRAAYLTSALVVMHDLALDDFVRGLKAAGEPLGYMAAREAARLRRHVTDPDVVRNEPLREPWCAHVARRARGIVVHSDFGRRYLESFGCRTPVFVVPHPVIEAPDAFERARGRARDLRGSPGAPDFLVVAPGDMNEAKQLDALVNAAAHLGQDTHVAIVGRRIEAYDVEPIVAAAGMSGRVSVHADVGDAEFLAWLVAADAVVDLRFPHRGEVSGSLSRAMQAGTPSVVSATGTYLDVPDGAVVRIAPGPADPDELAHALLRLRDDDDLRARVGGAAAAHIERLRTSEASARGYERAITETLALVRDPARKALAIWGRSLVDAGITEDLVLQGFGLDYARALASFEPGEEVAAARRNVERSS
ncbi:MAG TPA: glycosyltransferase [Actinomycetota bacterium]|nr:glycosyltransferase [Actinomycetota bacterium]